MNTWDQLATDAEIEKTTEALNARGISVVVAKNKEEAKKIVLDLIPEGEEVMTMSSVTLESMGLEAEINESDKYDSVKKKLSLLDRETQGLEMKKIGSAPKYALGSVHAVTQDGQVLIASNTGSQLSGYVYGAQQVIWVVGTQKIVKNIEEGMERLNSYVVPLEDEHMQKLYGIHTNVSKLLIFNKEIIPGRIHLVFVNENVGF